MRTTYGKAYDEWNNSQDDYLIFKVTSTRYFETRRGLGYECTTNVKGISIWNDGQGGGTYLNNDNMNDEFHHLTEDQLEKLIDKYELNKKQI